MLALGLYWAKLPRAVLKTKLNTYIDIYKNNEFKTLLSGGMALPDSHKYFLATQLVTAIWWLSHSSTMLEATIVGSLEALQALVFRGPIAPYPLTPSMATTIGAWRAGSASKKYPDAAVSLTAPLWKNPSLPPFFMLPEPAVWSKY